MKVQKPKAGKRRTHKPTKTELAATRKGEEVKLDDLLASLNRRCQPKITKTISESAGRFKTGRYEA